jgi:hypothetical protein
VTLDVTTKTTKTLVLPAWFNDSERWRDGERFTLRKRSESLYALEPDAEAEALPPAA